MASTPCPALDPGLVRRASQWWVDLQSESATASLRQACLDWRQADPEHERAWQRVQQVTGQLHGVPEPLIQATLLTPRRAGRRQAIKTLLLLAGVTGTGAATIGLAPWTDWRADESTRVGEIRRIRLPDGSLVVLNTHTAVDIRYGAAERRLVLLRGEMLVTTAADALPEARPFLVDTAHGTLRALGTRFLVRQHGDDSELQVYEGAVEVRTTRNGSAAEVVHAGFRVRFDGTRAAPAGPAQETSATWTRNMLVATAMPLRQFLHELARYRRGHLGCEDEIAELQVSGTFPLGDTDRVLRALEYELPVDVHRYTNYWLTLRARRS
ncbi:FecR domain-containing protein [Bordetella petrii]|uniref:FecR domain-containing protein n=1 Tax=Bordetella petrii TaxID=94624 RepID=UPI001E5E9949|nr:FecR domain-containing protein [Bordetella petrii]MCD0501596.1 FecR domain-containing protein [Bordetella petrii]